MKTSEWFLYSIKIAIIFLISILTYSSSGRAQELATEPIVSESPQTVVATLEETKNHQSEFSLTPENGAIAAAVADGLTTNLALSAGAVESNPTISASPIGLIALTGIKIGLVKYSETLSEPEKRLTLKSTSAIWGGAAINNIAVYLAAPPHVPLIAGLFMGIATWINMGNKYEQADVTLAARQIKLLDAGEKVAELQPKKTQ